MTDNNEKKALKAGVWYTVTNYLAKGAVYLTIPIFSATMSIEEIGKYMNINAWLQILLPILTLGFSSSLTLARFDYKNEFSRYTSSTLLYGSFFSLIIGIIFILFHQIFESLFNVDYHTLWIMVIYIITFPSLQFYQNINMFRYEYNKTAFITLVNFVIPLIVSLLFTFTWNNRLLGRIIGYYVPTIIICSIIYCLLLSRGWPFSLKYLPYSLKISFPLIWHTLALHLLATGDRIVITKTLGDESNAMYTIAYTVCGMVTILWSSMNSAWSPWCTERMNNGDVDLVKGMSKPYILFFSSIMVVVLLIAPEILFIMGGGKGYYEARFVIPPILTGIVAQFVYSLYVNLEFYHKMQIRIALGTILAAIINIILNLIFVPKFGYAAAGYTTLAGYLCLLFYHYYSVKSSKLNGWFDNCFIFMIIAFFLLILPFINYLYDYTLLRYVVLLLYIILLIAIALINKKNIMSAWKALSG